MSTSQQTHASGAMPKPAPQGKVEVGKGKTEAQETMASQEQAKLVEFCGIHVLQRELEVKDTDCTLKIDDKLNAQQRFCVANLFVEYANVATPDEIKTSGLPAWPMKQPWYQETSVPSHEKRTIHFRAILELLQRQLVNLPEFKDFKGHIATIDYMSLLSEKPHQFSIKMPPLQNQLH